MTPLGGGLKTSSQRSITDDSAAARTKSKTDDSASRPDGGGGSHGVRFTAELWVRLRAAMQPSALQNGTSACGVQDLRVRGAGWHLRRRTICPPPPSFRHPRLLWLLRPACR